MVKTANEKICDNFMIPLFIVVTYLDMWDPERQLGSAYIG
jgi:hypothetical protein